MSTATWRRRGSESKVCVDARLDVEVEEALAAVEVRRIRGVKLVGLRDIDSNAVYRQNTLSEGIGIIVDETCDEGLLVEFLFFTI